MKTRIILNQDISTIGHTGEVVEVSSGYARNYLLPMGLAYPYSKSNVQRLEKASKEAELKRLQLEKEFTALADKLSAVQLTFEEKASEAGHLYGSVNASRVATKLAKQEGIEIEERNIRLPEPLKEVGEYEVAVHVHGEMEAMLKVWVVAAQAAEA